MTKNIIWFKTRVGLVSISEPTEILVHKNTKESNWSIFARLKVGPEMTMRNVLGTRKGTMGNPSSYLAIFSDGPGVGEAIAECMARIEVAIRTKAEFCDLSQSGDPQAWGKAWQQIQWPS
jgi:hypothetical protein